MSPCPKSAVAQLDTVLGSHADLKASNAGGLVQVWPCHFQQFCRFLTSMSDAELQAVWGKDEKQVKKLIDKDAKRKVAMAASVTQIHLAEEAIKMALWSRLFQGSSTPPHSLPKRI